MAALASTKPPLAPLARPLSGRLPPSQAVRGGMKLSQPMAALASTKPPLAPLTRTLSGPSVLRNAPPSHDASGCGRSVLWCNFRHLPPTPTANDVPRRLPCGQRGVSVLYTDMEFGARSCRTLRMSSNRTLRKDDAWMVRQYRRGNWRDSWHLVDVRSRRASIWAASRLCSRMCLAGGVHTFQMNDDAYDNE